MAWVIKSSDDILGVYATAALAYADVDKSGTYEELTDAELEAEQRAWRNKELKATDWVVPITDHPERSDYLTYRTNLRDWPSTDSFPNTRPTL